MNDKSESEYRKDIIEICKRVYRNGWVASNDGNISIKLDQDTVLCTPTGMSKGYLTTDQLIKVDIKGRKLEGELRPSSEIKMHIEMYNSKPSINSVVHAHPPTATGFAVAGIPLDQCILPEIIIAMGSIPIAPYGTPSTDELPDSVREYLKDHDVFLLANHGALSIGEDVYKAYYRMESLELFAKINLIARQLGNVNVLDEQRVRELIDLRKDYFGIRSEYPGCNIDGKVIKEGTKLNSQISSNGEKTIEITESELVKLVSTIVNNLLKDK